MCPRIAPTTWSSLSPGPRTRTHIGSVSPSASRLASIRSVMPRCWRGLGVAAFPAAHPDLRDAGRRVRRPASGGPAARPPGPALFIYLVVNRHRQAARDELAEALWREPDPGAVEARLNPLLSKLRRVFGGDVVDGRPRSGYGCPVPGSTSKPPPRPSTGPSPLSSSRTGRGPGGRRYRDARRRARLSPGRGRPVD